MKNSFTILLMVLLLSCGDNRKKEITQLVAEWQNKEILFPANPVFTSYATDTVGYIIPPSSYKVVIYADSLGCISCKMQLDKWKTFIELTDSITGSTVPFLFFLDSRDQKEMKHILRRDRFTYPVCIDNKGEFNKLNRLPDDATFHTFLLDGENRVRLIGNPIYNAAMRELYLKEFCEFVQNKN